MPSVQAHNKGWTFPLPWAGSVAEFFDFADGLASIAPEMRDWARLDPTDIYASNALFGASSLLNTGGPVDRYLSRHVEASEGHWRLSAKHKRKISAPAVIAYLLWARRVRMGTVAGNVFVFHLKASDKWELSETMAKTPVLSSMVSCYVPTDDKATKHTSLTHTLTSCGTDWRRGQASSTTYGPFGTCTPSIVRQQNSESQVRVSIIEWSQ